MSEKHSQRIPYGFSPRRIFDVTLMGPYPPQMTGVVPLKRCPIAPSRFFGRSGRLWQTLDPSDGSRSITSTVRSLWNGERPPATRSLVNSAIIGKKSKSSFFRKSTFFNTKSESNAMKKFCRKKVSKITINLITISKKNWRKKI